MDGTPASDLDRLAQRPSPRWKRRKESRPSELIDAALTLFAEFGYAQTRLDDVAARAGISKGTVYLYFTSKQDLFEAVVRDRAAPWMTAIALREIDHTQTTEAALRDFLTRGWNQFLESKLYLIARIVLAESNNFPHLAEAYLREVMGPVHDHVVGLLERGIARGEIQGQASRERAKVLLAPLSWFALWRQALGAQTNPPCEQTYISEAIEMACKSVRGAGG
jgi:AcrR family transcriptional regulator